MVTRRDAADILRRQHDEAEQARKSHHGARVCADCGAALDRDECGWPRGDGTCLCQLCWERICGEVWFEALADADRGRLRELLLCAALWAVIAALLALSLWVA